MFEGFLTGLGLAMDIAQLTVVALVVWWAIKAARRIGELEREVSFLKGRSAAPDAPRPHDRQAQSVYDLGDGAATPPRPARRP